MSNTNFRGPVNSMGAMEDSTSSIDDGPMYAYQGVIFPNLRSNPFQKDAVGPGRVPGYLINPQFVTVDNIPSTATTTIVALAAAATSGTAMTLLTVAPGNTTAGVPSAATGVPIIPFGQSAPVTVSVMLDFGFATGTTVAGSSAVVVVDNTLFTLGSWIAVGGAGNAAKTSTLLTQVTAVSTANSTTINVFPVPLGSLVNAPINGGNLFSGAYLPPSTQYGPTTAVPTAVTNTIVAGMFRVFGAGGAISRNISVTSATAVAAGGAFKVAGYDIHNQAMSETLTLGANTTATLYGKKAFKSIMSVVPQFTDTATYSIGIGDTFGFPVRADRQEYVDWSWNGIVKTNQTGFLGSVNTSASLTSGDVRGTLQVSAFGAGTGIATNTASNGIARLFIQQTLPAVNTIYGTPTQTAPFFGVNNNGL